MLRVSQVILMKMNKTIRISILRMNIKVKKNLKEDLGIMCRIQNTLRK